MAVAEQPLNPSPQLSPTCLPLTFRLLVEFCRCLLLNRLTVQPQVCGCSQGERTPAGAMDFPKTELHSINSDQFNLLKMWSTLGDSNRLPNTYQDGKTSGAATDIPVIRTSVKISNMLPSIFLNLMAYTLAEYEAICSQAHLLPTSRVIFKQWAIT